MCWRGDLVCLRTRQRREGACARPYPYEPAFSDQAGTFVRVFCIT
jgi:hypothetical protein